jgi:hypothetical protein
MATSSVLAARLLDEKGVRRLGTGAGLGFAGALAAIVLPLAFLLIVTDDPGGFFVFGSTLVQSTSILILVGAILLLLSLFFYRRAFSALRKVDPRFTVASVLCIIGSIGFLLLLVTAAVVVGNASSLLACAHGQPSHALSCLKSGEPFGAVTGTIGFLLGWIGGVGVLFGLSLAGSRFGVGALSGAAVFYGLLLVVLIVPFVNLLVTIPDTRYLILIAPVFAILAPALALAGSMRATAKIAPA